MFCRQVMDELCSFIMVKVHPKQQIAIAPSCIFRDLGSCYCLVGHSELKSHLSGDGGMSWNRSDQFLLRVNEGLQIKGQKKGLCTEYA